MLYLMVGLRENTWYMVYGICALLVAYSVLKEYHHVKEPDHKHHAHDNDKSGTSLAVKPRRLFIYHNRRMPHIFSNWIYQPD